MTLGGRAAASLRAMGTAVVVLTSAALGAGLTGCGGPADTDALRTVTDAAIDLQALADEPFTELPEAAPADAGRGRPRSLDLDVAPAPGDRWDLAVTATFGLELIDPGRPPGANTVIRAQTDARADGILTVDAVDETGTITAARFASTFSALVRDSSLIATLPAAEPILIERRDERYRVTSEGLPLDDNARQLLELCVLASIAPTQWNAAIGLGAERPRRRDAWWAIDDDAAAMLLGTRAASLEPLPARESAAVAAWSGPLRVDGAAAIGVDVRAVGSITDAPSLDALFPAGEVTDVMRRGAWQILVPDGGGPTIGEGSMIRTVFTVIDEGDALRGERVEQSVMRRIPLPPIVPADASEPDGDPGDDAPDGAAVRRLSPRG